MIEAETIKFAPAPNHYTFVEIAMYAIQTTTLKRFLINFYNI